MNTKPLKGKSVVVTRASHQNADLVKAFSELGADSPTTSLMSELFEFKISEACDMFFECDFIVIAIRPYSNNPII